MINLVASLAAASVTARDAQTLRAMNDELTVRVGTVLIEFLTPTQVEEHEEQEASAAGADEWVRTELRHREAIVWDVLDAMVAEARGLADTDGRLPLLAEWPVTSPPGLPTMAEILWIRGVRRDNDELVRLGDGIRIFALRGLAEQRCRSATPAQASELRDLLAAVHAGELPHSTLLEYCSRLDGEEPTQRAYLRILGDTTQDLVALYHGRTAADSVSSDSVTD